MSEKLSAEAVFLRYKNEELPEFVCRELSHVNQRGNMGNTPLHVACSRGIPEEVEALLAGGADVNARGERNDTPLHDAAGAGHLTIVNMLLQKGADTNLVNQDGNEPRDLAALMKHMNIVSALDGWTKKNQQSLG